MKRFHFTPEMLREETARLQEKRFSPGADGMTAEEAALWMEVNAAHLCKELNAGKYTPTPAQVFVKAKAGGGARQLTKLTAIDTVIQRILYREIGSLCESFFSAHSHAYRVSRGVASALRDFCEQGRGYRYAAVIDPVDCFDSINRDILMAAARERLPETFHTLLYAYSSIPRVEGGKVYTPEKGIPQGAPLSDLMCNLYFDPLDRMLTEQGAAFVRYADDVALFAETPQALGTLCCEVKAFFTDRLALTPHPRKCAQGAPETLVFLGHRFTRDRFGLTARPAEEKEASFYADWQQSELVDPMRRTDIFSNGCLRAESGGLIFESAAQTASIPVAATDTINIHGSVSIDAGVLKCAAENGIVISVFDQADGLIGRFLPNAPLKSPSVNCEQLSVYMDPAKRAALAREFVLAAIHNLRLVIRYYNKQNPNDAYRSALNKINRTAAQIKTCESVEDLLLLEAGVHAAYFGVFDLFLEKAEFKFEKRTRRPPKNEVNAMISFCDTVLYHLIATEIYTSPLDIRIGFLHAANRRPESLNLDLAESFRPLVVDRTVLSLINLRAIRPEHFTVSDDKVYLTGEGKRLLLRALYQRLNTSVAVNGGKNLTYAAAIREEVRALTRFFRTGEPFHAFHQVR